MEDGRDERVRAEMAADGIDIKKRIQEHRMVQLYNISVGH
jgi:hypothetical protein